MSAPPTVEPCGSTLKTRSRQLLPVVTNFPHCFSNKQQLHQGNCNKSQGRFKKSRIVQPHFTAPLPTKIRNHGAVEEPRMKKTSTELQTREENTELQPHERKKRNETTTTTDYYQQLTTLQHKQHQQSKNTRRKIRTGQQREENNKGEYKTTLPLVPQSGLTTAAPLQHKQQCRTIPRRPPSKNNKTVASIGSVDSTDNDAIRNSNARKKNGRHKQHCPTAGTRTQERKTNSPFTKIQTTLNVGTSFQGFWIYHHQPQPYHSPVPVTELE